MEIENDRLIEYVSSIKTALNDSFWTKINQLIEDEHQGINY